MRAEEKSTKPPRIWLFICTVMRNTWLPDLYCSRLWWKRKECELHDAPVPWASLSRSHTRTGLLKVEEVYNLSKQANFIKHLPFSINCCHAQIFSHQLRSWCVCFSRRNCWFGPDDVSDEILCICKECTQSPVSLYVIGTNSRRLFPCSEIQLSFFSRYSAQQ